MTPEHIMKIADAADPHGLWRAVTLTSLELSPGERLQRDTGIALRRYAQFLSELRGALVARRSILITPLSESGSAVRLIDTPGDHAELRAAREPNPSYAELGHRLAARGLPFCPLGDRANPACWPVSYGAQR